MFMKCSYLSCFSSEYHIHKPFSATVHLLHTKPPHYDYSYGGIAIVLEKVSGMTLPRSFITKDGRREVTLTNVEPYSQAVLLEEFMKCIQSGVYNMDEYQDWHLSLFGLLLEENYIACDYERFF